MRIWFGIITAATFGGVTALGQDGDPPADVVIPQVLGQPADDDVLRADPIRPRDEAAAARVEALAHFMAGEVFQKRRDLGRALAEYEAAADLTPESFEVLAAYVPLAYASGRRDDAEDAVIKAAANIDRGHELARSLATVMARSGRQGAAARLLEKLLAVPRVTDRIGVEMLTRRDLGLIEQGRGSSEDAAEQFRIVFEALEGDRLSDSERATILTDAGAAYEAFGEAFLAVEDAELAVRAFDRAAAERPGTPAVHAFNLATVFRKTGNPEKALAELDKYLAAQLQTKGVAAYELLRDLYTELDREDELLPRLSALLELDKRNTTLRFFYADQLLAADRADDAKTQYEVALGGGRDLRGLTGLIEIARREEDAESLFDHIVDAFPLIARGGDTGDVFEKRWADLVADEKMMDAVVAVAKRRAEDESDPLDLLPTYIFARLLVEADRVRDAYPFFRRAIELPSVSRYSLAAEASEPLFDERMFAEAATLWKLATEDESSSAEGTRPNAFLFLARSSALAGDADTAEEAVRQGRALSPGNPVFDFEAGVTLSILKQWDKAAELFGELVDQLRNDDDRNPGLLRRAEFQLSNALTQLGQTDRGAEILLKILEDDPGNAQANNDLGYLWADAGMNLERAEKMIRRALKQEPENAAYLDSLGWVLYRQGDLDGAEKYLSEAVEKSEGNDSVLHEHLGDVFRDKGEVDAAKASYEKALELEKDPAGGQPDEELVKRVTGKLSGLAGGAAE